MNDISIAFENVSKKFKKGQIYDSLRDLLPFLAKSAFRRYAASPLAHNEFWVLKDISFDVRKGESVGIIGHNGAGKSTMLKHLSGIMKPTSGRITVNGKLSALIEVGAGFHPDLTGRENIFLNGTILGMSRAEVRAKFDEIVDFSGLENFIDTPVKRYSSGMYARLGFSVAVHLEPDILVVDEVLSVGDYAFQQKGLDRMKSILDGGATVLFVSHNLKAVSELCQRVILLDRGEIIGDGACREVINAYFRKTESATRSVGDKEVAITGIKLYGASGEEVRFHERSKARLEVTVSGRKKCDKLSVSITLTDDDTRQIFDTSTERLSGKSFSISEGQEHRFVFELDMNLGPGTYHIGSYIYRYDLQKTYDMVFPAKTFFVTSDRDAHGVVNLYPTLLEC